MNYLDLTFGIFDDHPIICLLFLWAFWWLIIPVWTVLGISWFILKLFSVNDNMESKNLMNKDPFPSFSEIYNKLHNA